jgi:hypothetical protein
MMAKTRLHMLAESLNIMMPVTVAEQSKAELRSLRSRDHGFGSHSGYECLVFVYVCVFLCLCIRRGLATS